MSATLYIYADGADLEETAAAMHQKIEDFTAAYGERVRVVDQRAEKKNEGADLPDWELGVNFETNALTDAEMRDLLLFFQSLSAQFDREFVIGLTTPFGQSEDIAFVSATEPLEQPMKALLKASST